MIIPFTSTTVELQAGDRWIFDFAVYDDDGNIPATDPLPSVTLISPGSSSSMGVSQLSNYVYRGSVAVNVLGRTVASIYTADFGVLGFVNNVVASVTTAADMPTVAKVRDYAEESKTIGDWSDADIQAVLDSEATQQRRRCDINATYPPDLFEALCRRVVLALNRRSKLNAGDFSTGVLGGENQAFIPMDPEVKRLEAPYRKVVMF